LGAKKRKKRKRRLTIAAQNALIGPGGGLAPGFAKKGVGQRGQEPADPCAARKAGKDAANEANRFFAPLYRIAAPDEKRREKGVLMNDNQNGAGGHTDNSSKLILMVDDAQTIRDAGRSFLTKAGYTVVMAEDGFAALEIVWAQRPDLIFMDVNMPRLNGYDTTEAIKQNEELRDIPIVMLSGEDSVFDKARGMFSGASEYLVKPFSRENLIATVERHLLNNSRG